MVKGNRTVLAMKDPQNALGRAYAASLHEKASALRSTFFLTAEARLSMAEDLEALAYLASNHPEVFGYLQRSKRNGSSGG